MANIKRSRTSKKLVNNKLIPFTFNKSIPSRWRYKNVNNNAESKKYKKNCACVTCQQRSTEANSAIIYPSDDINTLEKLKTFLKNNELQRKRLLIDNFKFDTLSWSAITIRERIFNPLKHHYTSLPDVMNISKKCYIKGPFYLEQKINLKKVIATATGTVEWSYIQQEPAYPGRPAGYLLLFAKSEFPEVDKDINYVELFDIYTGKLTWKETTAGWIIFNMDDDGISYDDITENINNSAFQSKIHEQNEPWGKIYYLKIEISVSNVNIDNVYIPKGIDSNYKITATTAGNVEYIGMQNYNLFIDRRYFTGEGKNFTHIELLDIYNGKLTWFNTDIYYHIYHLDDLSHEEIQKNINNSAFQSLIRGTGNIGEYYSFKVDFSITRSGDFFVNNIDSTLIDSKFILNEYEPAPLNRHQLLINVQPFRDYNIDPTKFNKINLLNGLYDGPVIGGEHLDEIYLIYYIQGDITSKIKNFDFTAVNGTKNEDEMIIIQEINGSSYCKVSDYRNPIIGYRKTHCSKKEEFKSLDTIYQDIHAKSCFDENGNCLKDVYYYNRPRNIINKKGYLNETYNYSTNQYLTRRCNTIKQRESVIFDKKVSCNKYVSCMNCDYDANNNVICNSDGFRLKVNDTPCNINKAKCYSIYKRSNRKFNTQGAVSGGSRVQHLKRLNQKCKQKQGLKYNIF